MKIRDSEVFFGRLGRDGALGFGESYLLGAIDCGRPLSSGGGSADELAEWLTVFGCHLKAKESSLFYLIRRLWRLRCPISEPNTEEGARANVQAHYDLDPRLFEIFLEQSMTYSSAWFEPGDDLSRAQVRKIDAILDLARVNSAARVLDIGSGFGGLAIRAAKDRGAKVVGLTLSRKQLEYAELRTKAAGLGERVRFILEDYRRHQGVYDAIVSVEMIEAVGSDYWREYFRTIDRLLKPGGYFAIQLITFPHRKMLASKKDYSWVDRYIFPGGELPSLRAVSNILKSDTSLEVIDARRLSDSYARTLQEWRHRFVDAIGEVKRLGFDDTFCRLWKLYFAYFEAAFRSRYCDAWQLGMRKRDHD